MGTDNAGAAEKVAPLADGVLAVTGGDYSDGAADAFTWALEQLAAQYEPAAVLAGNTPLGREMTARLCARLGLGSVQDATALTWDGDTPVWTVPLYGGTVLNDVVVDTLPVVATTRSGAFAKPEAGQAGPVTPGGAPGARRRGEGQGGPGGEGALRGGQPGGGQGHRHGGRGMGSKEQFALVEELAALLGGVVGATRPAIEDGWVSRAHQVGQSGKIVAPALYIACGVSGATQHVSGMSGSGYVVAINKDEDAPIFDVADVGIVGDVAKVLPLMIEGDPSAQGGVTFLKADPEGSRPLGGRALLFFGVAFWGKV